MIIYDRLWKTMNDKGITIYSLEKDHGIVRSQMKRFQRNCIVTTYTLNRLCNALQCDINDILEFVPDKKE